MAEEHKPAPKTKRVGELARQKADQERHKRERDRGRPNKVRHFKRGSHD